jgi:transcription initiation factor TFIID TATA-box-binding protein
MRNAEYNPKRFSGVIVRLRDPKTTALLFSSGKVICAGAKSESDSALAMKKYVCILRRLGFAEASMRDFRVQNVVGLSDVRFPVRLEAMAVKYPQFCCYEPEIFPGLVFRLSNPRVCVIVFVSGKVVLTGGRSKQHLNDALVRVYPVLYEFCKESFREEVTRLRDGVSVGDGVGKVV